MVYNENFVKKFGGTSVKDEKSRAAQKNILLHPYFSPLGYEIIKGGIVLFRY